MKKQKKNDIKPKKRMVDVNGLVTVKKYSIMKGETRQNIYVQIGNNKLKHEKIDGVLFIKKNQ
jgi:hypothetical protein